MDVSIKELYNKRYEEISKTICFKEPENVPIVTDVVYWPLAYAHTKLEDILGKPEKQCAAFVKIFNDLYTDAIAGGGIAANMELIRTLGIKNWFISDDEITVQHDQNCVLRLDEYEAYSDDPERYAIDTLSRRKFPKLNGDDGEVYNCLKQACKKQIVHNKGNQKIRQYLTEKKGIVSIQGNGLRAPLDIIFDYIRGFKETIMDMRRYKKEVQKACQALFEEDKKTLNNFHEKVPVIPFFTTPVHALPFINREQFENFWWPYYKELAETVVKMGGKIRIKGEGYCEFALDYFADAFPPGTFIWQFDQDNPYEMYKKYGDKFIFQCGIDNNVLKVCSEKECIDAAKRAVDTFAQGGGFLFSTTKVILCANEVNAQNLIAVHNFVREYGKY